MTMYDVAAIVLAVLALGWWVIKYFKGEDPNDKLKGAATKGEDTFLWLNLDLINGLAINPMLLLLWFGGNIFFGNLVALTAGIAWLNTLNGEVIISIPYFVLMGFSMAPSFIQWWIETTPPSGQRDEDWIYWGGWVFVGIDVFLCVAGYWSYFQMPTDFDLLTWSHFVAGMIFLAIAVFTNVYCESALHVTIEELHFTLTGRRREKVKKKKREEKREKEKKEKEKKEKKEKKKKKGNEKKKEEEYLPTDKQLPTYLMKNAEKREEE